MANKYRPASREALEAAQRQRGCESKVAYPTPEAAFQKGQEFYLCKYCGKYHRSGKLAKLIAETRRGTRLKSSSKWTKRS